MDIPVGERFKKIRNHLGLTQTEFAKRIDVWVGTVNRIEHNIQKPSYDFMQKLTAEFNVNPMWLLHEKGEMFSDAIVTSPKAAPDLQELCHYLSAHPSEVKLFLKVIHGKKIAGDALGEIQQLHQPKLKQKPA